MKEFELWEQKKYPSPLCYERGPINRYCLKQRKHAWQAALEWALANATYDERDYEIIKKELEE